jgi:hypothetical protein
VQRWMEWNGVQTTRRVRRDEHYTENDSGLSHTMATQIDTTHIPTKDRTRDNHKTKADAPFKRPSSMLSAAAAVEVVRALWGSVTRRPPTVNGTTADHLLPSVYGIIDSSSCAMRRKR